MYWLNFFDQIFKFKKNKKRTKQIPLFSIASLQFPSYMNKIKLAEMKELIQNQLATYTSLGFAKMEMNELRELKNYTTYEVMLLLKYLQFNVTLFIPSQETFFPKYMHSHNDNTIKQNIALIIAKYNESISPSDTKSTLSTTYIWSPYEITFLLYYATMDRNDIV